MNGENILVSYGIIKDINEEKGIFHTCNTDKGSSGAPILSLKNNKLIGIHYGSPNIKKEYNYGTLIIYAIIEFNKVEISEIKEEKITNTNKLINAKINTNLNTNEMTIIYKIPLYEKRIKIFGREFIENNINNCKIIIEKEIKEYIYINNDYNKDKLEIKLKEIKTITNMSHMFDGCESLLSLPDIFKWDTKNVTDMSHMFNGCKSLSTIPDIFNWDTKNVNNMSYMFTGCDSLYPPPDISKWDTQNVTNMSYMFENCHSSTLPDISKWDTQNVTDMSHMFDGCKSLSLLPDISKWDTQKLTNIFYMFKDCKKLSKSYIPKKFREGCLII